MGNPISCHPTLQLAEKEMSKSVVQIVFCMPLPMFPVVCYH